MAVEQPQLRHVRHRHARSMASYLLAAAALMLLSRHALAEEAEIDTKQGTIKVQTLANGLEHPWGLAFLPDGRMLVTERPGRLRIVDQGRRAIGAARRACPRSSQKAKAACWT